MTQNNFKQFAFTEAQIAGLIAKQDTLNSYIHEDWKRQGFDWMVAVQDEIMEIRGHLGWKWWRPGYLQGLTDANRAQVKLEVIDLLHFLISDWIEGHWDKYLLENFTAPTGQVEIGYCLNRCMEFAATGRSDVLGECWTKLAHCVGLTEQEILETYTQKYVLNKFRQDHGYKTGEYCKNWELLSDIGKLVDGVADCYVAKHYEDNQVLEFVVASYKASGVDTTNETVLYIKLESLYNSRLNKG